MIGGYYIINDDKTVTPVDDDDPRRLEAFKDRDRKRVAQTTLEGSVWVSTVFLGLDHSFGDGPPLLFETMVFPSQDNLSEQLCWRYPTYDDAQAGHEAAVVAANKVIAECRELDELWGTEQPAPKEIEVQP